MNMQEQGREPKAVAKQSVTFQAQYERVARWRDFARTSTGIRLYADGDAGTPVELTVCFVTPFDMGNISTLAYGFTHEGPELDMFLIYGPDPATILQRYATLTGFAPVPPR